MVLFAWTSAPLIRVTPADWTVALVVPLTVTGPLLSTTAAVVPFSVARRPAAIVTSAPPGPLVAPIVGHRRIRGGPGRRSAHQHGAEQEGEDRAAKQRRHRVSFGGVTPHDGEAADLLPSATA